MMYDPEFSPLKQTAKTMSVYLLLVVMFFSFQTVIHEQTHVEIFDRYGCDNISVSYVPQLSGDEPYIASTEAVCLPQHQTEIDAQNQIVHTVQNMVMLPALILLFIVAFLMTDRKPYL